MKKAKKAAALMVTLGLLFTAPVFAQDGALDQLKQMTGGNEHTGVKFDGSSKEQPKSGVDVVVNTSTTTVTPSSGTASGYEVNKSSSTGNNDKKK